MKTKLLLAFVLILSIKMLTAQTVAIPDANFEQALIDANVDSNGLNGNILESDATSITNLSLNGKGINNLTGIEAFTNLTTLVVSNNNLATIDLSANTALLYVDCSNNLLTELNLNANTLIVQVVAQANLLETVNVENCPDLYQLSISQNNLSNLDVSNNLALENLFCISNQLSSIDVSNNVNLSQLLCYSNNLTQLDVSSNINLERLYCQGNNITSLDISNNPQILEFDCSGNDLVSLNAKNGNNADIVVFAASINPNLECIEVDDVAYSTANWTNIDIQSYFSLSCSQTVAIPDANFEQALIDLGYDTNGLNGNILRTEAEAVTSLDVHAKNISSLSGIEGFINVSVLKCHENQLTSLNLNSNINLTQLNCRDNQLTSLELSNNVLLNNMNCYNNQITSLDLSNNGLLTFLLCDSNDLEELNVKNGNNNNVTFFSALGNPNLFCIQVDDKSYSENNWTDVDSQVVFRENCNITVPIPDANFEQALIDLGYDTNGLNGNILLYESEAVSVLVLSNKNINSLEGIEGFYNITALYVDNNNLSSLNLYGNIYLQALDCSFNALTSIDLPDNNVLNTINVSNNLLETLDVSNNGALSTLNCVNNQLISLDVSTNTQLTELYAAYNNLTGINVNGADALINLGVQFNSLGTLNVTNNPLLQYLTCNSNSLSSLDLVGNPNLINVTCNDNSLSQLDVSSNAFLDAIDCSNNQLTYLNVKNGNNTNILGFSALNNPGLNCIQVDDEVYSTSNWSAFIDAQTSFSEDCSTLGIEENTLTESLQLYPNPSSNKFYVNGIKEASNISIYDLNGREILRQIIQPNQSISISHIPNGVYLVGISNNNGIITKKLVIN